MDITIGYPTVLFLTKTSFHELPTLFQSILKNLIAGRLTANITSNIQKASSIVVGTYIIISTATSCTHYSLLCCLHILKSFHKIFLNFSRDQSSLLPNLLHLCFPTSQLRIQAAISNWQSRSCLSYPLLTISVE